MQERIVYLSGKFVPESQAKLSIFDRGFLYGDAAYDITRTYDHKLFKISEYIDRLYSSLNYIRLDPGISKKEMEIIANEVLDRNLSWLGKDVDCRLVIRISRGAYDSPPETGDLTPGNPTVIVYCSPINFAFLAKKYVEGVHVVVSSIRRTTTSSVSPKAKLHNKINHILADMEAKLVDPQAYCLMLDEHGMIAEGYSSNVFLVRNGMLCTPPNDNSLGGITQRTILQLAEKSNIPSIRAELELYDILNAEEAFFSASSYVILPISRVNNRQIGLSVPGLVTSKLIKAWEEHTGINIINQAFSQVNESKLKLVSRTSGKRQDPL